MDTIYALIMTINAIGYYNKPVTISVSTIDNFENEKACLYAGAQQEVELRQKYGLQFSKNYTFICVKKK